MWSSMGFVFVWNHTISIRIPMGLQLAGASHFIIIQHMYGITGHYPALSVLHGVSVITRDVWNAPRILSGESQRYGVYRNARASSQQNRCWASVSVIATPIRL